MPAKIELADDVIAEMVRLYTEEQLATTKIATRLGVCSQQVVGRILREQGVKLKGRRILTDGEEEQIVKMYQHGIRCVDIVRVYKISLGYVRKMLIRRNIAPNRPAQYELDEHAFDIIDSEASSYWLGFVAADGCVHKNRLSIVLAIRDIHHLTKIKTFLKTDRPLRISKRETFGKEVEQVAFYVNNDHLAERLKELGILRGRPHYRLATDSIPINLLHHFLRGYIDGDGSIGRNRPRVRLCGQKDFLEWVRLTFHSFLNLSLECPISSSSNISNIAYHGYKNTKKILEFLYRDATIYLERKRKLANQWM